MTLTPSNVPAEPVLSALQALDRTQTNLAVNVLSQVEMEGALDDRLVVENILELKSAE